MLNSSCSNHDPGNPEEACSTSLSHKNPGVRGFALCFAVDFSSTCLQFFPPKHEYLILSSNLAKLTFPVQATIEGSSAVCAT